MNTLNIAFLDTAEEQFKLKTIELYNWGTFEGLVTFDIANKGFLFTGASGSGKSTVMDANAALMTPPKWLHFNVAAREGERRGKDRNYMSYVRGAWAKQTESSGEHAVQYLRKSTTWSAILETYQDGLGHVVTLVRLFWVRGKSVQAKDVDSRFMVLEHQFSVRELQFFVDANFEVRTLKPALPDAYITHEFAAYQERFRRLLGIENERALRLLHKTQSAKDLGDLNAFMRDFMLDPPETFELADNLVLQFTELKDAHRAVVEAREQIETLRPAREEATELDRKTLERNQLDELLVGLDIYKEQQKEEQFEIAVSESNTRFDGLLSEHKALKQTVTNEQGVLTALKERRLNMGGGLIERLNTQLMDAERARETRVQKRNDAQTAYALLEWTLPTTALAFAQGRDEASRLVRDAKEFNEQLGERNFKARTRQTKLKEERAEVQAEIRSLESRRSNIRREMQDLRSRIAAAVNVPEDKLPFAGELIEVKPEEAEWQPAIERLLRGFAETLLVEDRYHESVMAYVDKTHLGQLLVCQRVMEIPTSTRATGPKAVVRKLNTASSPLSIWVRETLKAQFEHDCVETMEEFHQTKKALTKQGLIKDGSRSRKDDRGHILDRSKWSLGLDNAPKRGLFRSKEENLTEQIDALEREIKDIANQVSDAHNRLLCANKVSNLAWEDIDVNGAIAKVEALKAELAEQRNANPNLGEVEADIKQQEAVYDAADKAERACHGKIQVEEAQRDGFLLKIKNLKRELIETALTPWQQAGLSKRFASLPGMTHENVDQLSGQVVKALNLERQALTEEIRDLGASIERRFLKFISVWPAEAAGLDAKLASAPDLFAKLERLEADGLPKYEARFLELLKDQSTQNLTRLLTQLNTERKAIRDRMNIVNLSLANAEFNAGTHLVIEVKDRVLQEVQDFNKTIRETLNQATSDDPVVAEARFKALDALVQKFASQETVDKNWREQVLDVRQHVEFLAREFDENGQEKDVFDSGAGKSGGQRQKLAATCLAAALRYQLGGQDRSLPRFSTVFMDEAFDKSDSEFTTIAMNIFETFGFQMVLATPQKNIMSLEPFIGGACFIDNPNRNASRYLPIEYVEAIGRLKLAPGMDYDEEAVAS